MLVSHKKTLKTMHLSKTEEVLSERLVNDYMVLCKRSRSNNLNVVSHTLQKNTECWSALSVTDWRICKLCTKPLLILLLWYTCMMALKVTPTYHKIVIAPCAAHAAFKSRWHSGQNGRVARLVSNSISGEPPWCLIGWLPMTNILISCQGGWGGCLALMKFI